MVYSSPDLSTIDQLHQRYVGGHALTTDEIGALFHVINGFCSTHQGLVVTAPKDTYAAVVAGYTHILNALARSGLNLYQETAEPSSPIGLVWFYRWEGGLRQGPFGTLDAAIGAAVLQIRSGVIK